LYHNKPLGLLAITFASIALSGIQLVADIDNYLFVAGNNLYKPMIHSLFYILGFVYFSASDAKNRWLLCKRTPAPWVGLVLTVEEQSIRRRAAW
jgi:hypothetical protein